MIRAEIDDPKTKGRFLSRAIHVASLPVASIYDFCPECECMLVRDAEARMLLCASPECLSGFIVSGGGWPE